MSFPRVLPDQTAYMDFHGFAGRPGGVLGAGSWATGVAVVGREHCRPILCGGLLYEQFEAFEITLLSPFRAGVDPALVDQNVDRVEPGDFSLEFIVMSLHQLIQFLDGDTFGMLTHHAKNQLDGTILLGEFSTVRHDCSFLPPFFLALVAMGDTWPEALSGIS
jgi:hypothetical protein